MTATVERSDVSDVAEPGLVRLLLRPEVLLVLVAGIALRAWILLTPLGTLNADEAYTGLQAAEITRGHLSVVIGGAAYTGTTDVYLLAPFVWVFGQHVVLLKLMSPVLWLVASVLTVGAARRIVADQAALLAGAMVWLAPGALAVLSTRSYVGYAFGLGVVVALAWSAFALVEREAPTVPASAVTGALAGLAFYTHPMFTAVAAPIVAVVALRWHRSLRDFWVPAVAAATVVNLPFLAWNAMNSWPSLDAPPNESGSTYTGRLRGFFTGLLPRDLGLRRVTDGAWLFGRPLAALVTLAVLGGAAYGAYRLVRTRPWPGAVLAAPLIAAWPLMAALTNLSFVDDGRYGIIVFPIMVLCLVAALDVVLDRLPPSAWLVMAMLWAVLLTAPFLAREAGSDLGDPNRRTQELIEALETEGFDRVAGNYWAVLPVEFQSGGHVRAAIAGNPYVIRLPHTQRLVAATPSGELAFVFAAGAVDENWLALPLDRYRQVPVAGWVIYFPT